MTTNPYLLAQADVRPCISHRTIAVGAFTFAQQPQDDEIAKVVDGGLHLTSSDSYFYPLVRLESHSREPNGQPADQWDYVRVFRNAAVEGHLSVAALFDAPCPGLELPPGPYDLRVQCRGRDHTPAMELFGEVPTEEPHEDPLEHWLIQLWPASQPTA
ncbi:hypothetical protein GCM10020000_56860 [Streptomyces olivoverticillatus]